MKHDNGMEVQSKEMQLGKQRNAIGKTKKCNWENKEMQ